MMDGDGMDELEVSPAPMVIPNEPMSMVIPIFLLRWGEVKCVEVMSVLRLSFAQNQNNAPNVPTQTPSPTQKANGTNGITASNRPVWRMRRRNASPARLFNGKWFRAHQSSSVAGKGEGEVMRAVCSGNQTHAVAAKVKWK